MVLRLRPEPLQPTFCSARPGEQELNNIWLVNKQEIQRRAKLVADQFDGIVPYCLAFYSLSIKYSVDRSDNAFSRYEKGLERHESDEFLVSSVHEALTHAASISRFFWPSGLGDRRFVRLRELRAKQLRAKFDLHSSSPLKNRRLRDSLEHFDERLDKFLLENDAGHFHPQAIIGSYPKDQEAIHKIFKLVDPSRNIFVVLGKEFAFASIRTAVGELKSKFEHAPGSLI